MKLNHRYLHRQRAINAVYSRAARAIIDRVAFALSNLGLEEFRWKIIRNFLRPASTVREQYTTLRSILNLLTSV